MTLRCSCLASVYSWQLERRKAWDQSLGLQANGICTAFHPTYASHRCQSCRLSRNIFMAIKTKQNKTKSQEKETSLLIGRWNQSNMVMEKHCFHDAQLVNESQQIPSEQCHTEMLQTPCVNCCSPIAPREERHAVTCFNSLLPLTQVLCWFCYKSQTARFA